MKIGVRDKHLTGAFFDMGNICQSWRYDNWEGKLHCTAILGFCSSTYEKLYANWDSDLHKCTQTQQSTKYDVI